VSRAADSATLRRNLAGFARREIPDGRRAAVAVTIYERAGIPGVLVVKRVRKGLNAGQWALPGGKLEGDEDVYTAALRELDEEAGLALAPDAVIGRLDDFATSSNFVITPVVVLAPPGARPRRDPREIASLHHVPLERLTAPGVPRWASAPDGGRLLQMPLRHDMVIHAPTGAILLQFAEVALRGRDTRVADLLQPDWTSS
jgi:8-oxo-dGTP pyrophosphatase MutT (NUDIX family)